MRNLFRKDGGRRRKSLIVALPHFKPGKGETSVTRSSASTVSAIAVAIGIVGFASAASAEVTIANQKPVGGSSQTYMTGQDGNIQFAGPSSPPAYGGLQFSEDPVYLPPGFLSPAPAPRYYTPPVVVTRKAKPRY